MLMPKRVKRRKQFRGTMAGKALRGNTISNGEYGLVALEPCWIKGNKAILTVGDCMALLPLSRAGSNLIRSRQPVLP